MAYDGTLGIQLYSVRDNLGPDELGNTLSRLKGFGFTHVEPYDILGYTDRLAAAVEANGLKTGTAHANIVALDRKSLIQAAKRLGIDTLIMPWVDERPSPTGQGSRRSSPARAGRRSGIGLSRTYI